jgi:hypothetical protein
MQKSIPLHRSREWKIALDNMEQMHPRYLANLLKDGTLAEVIRRQVVAYFQTLDRLQQSNPNEPLENLREMAQGGGLTAVNADWQDEEPLNMEEQELLKRFKRHGVRR